MDKTLASKRVAALAVLLVAAPGCGGETRCEGQVCAADAAGAPDSGGAADAPTAAGVGCSADLRSVLDANGTVIATCPPDQGCAEGACIEACAAAAASHGNLGCDFLVPTPPSYPPSAPPCFAAFVVNTWPRPARLTVTRGDDTYDVTTFGRVPAPGSDQATDWPAVPPDGIPVDEVAVLFLSSDPDSVMWESLEPLSCPVTPALDASTVVPGSGRAPAFRIRSDTPVTAYDILPYGGAPSHFPSAELLLPTSAWSTDYVVNSAPPGTYSQPGPQWLGVLAVEDSTTIEVRPPVDLPGGADVPTAPAGAVTALVLDAGQYAQWQLPSGALDPSGTLVAADGAIAVFAGNRFLRLQTAPAPGGESTHQQMIPVSALGHEYVAAPFETRRADLADEVIPYRLVGAFDGTVLDFDPDLPGAPATLDRGQVADFSTELAFRVSSQDEAHPFSAAQLMPTANLPGGTRPGATDPHYEPMLGDEEFVVMFSPAQFLSRYVFFTDPTYPTTNLVLTRIKTDVEFPELRIDCLGVIGGWRPVGTEGRYEVTTVDLVRADVGVGTCANGRHVAESNAPFGLVVWGEDSYSSYAYPAGGNAAQLADLPPIL